MANIETTAEKRQKAYAFINPNGHVSKTSNLHAFCEENSLSYSQMHKIASGKRKNHKGWSAR
jgi:hypothetical protein